MQYLICIQRKLNGFTTTYCLTKINDIYTYELLDRALNRNKSYFDIEEAKKLIPIAKKIMKKYNRQNYKILRSFNEHHLHKNAIKWNIFLLRESKIENTLKNLKELRKEELNNLKKVNNEF